MLNKIISQCKKYLKDDGYILVTDVAYSPNQPQTEFEHINMWHDLPEGKTEIEDFGVFRFHITDKADVGNYDLF